MAALVVVGTLVWLSACPRADPPLRVVATLWVGYQPFFLAEHLGLYSEDSIRLVEFSSNTESLRALRNRDVEAAALTLDEALLLSAEGHDIAAILVLDCSAGADALVARPELGILGDLAGHRVGVESSANGAFFLSRALNLAELAPADIEIVPLRIGDQVNAYRAGRVDALVTYEPLRTQLAALGAVTLFDSSMISCEIVDVLAVQRAMLNERMGQIEQLLRGWFAAVDYQTARPEETAALLAHHLGMQPPEYLAAMAGVELGDPTVNCLAFEPGTGEKGLAGKAEDLLRFMKESGLMRSDPDINRLMEPGPFRTLGCPPRPGSR